MCIILNEINIAVPAELYVNLSRINRKKKNVILYIALSKFEENIISLLQLL